jgi:hypothetical protein
MAKPQGLLSPLERQTYESFGIAPREDRLSLLPRYNAKTGLVAPQFVYDAAKALAAPYTAAQGYDLPPEEALNVGMNVMGGSSIGSAPRGALNMGIAYHGTTKPISQLNPKKSFGDLNVSWVSPNPEFASRYASREGGNVMPLEVNEGKVFDFADKKSLDKLTKKASNVQIYDPIRGSTTLDKFVPNAGESYKTAENPQLFNLIKKMGYDSVAVYEDGVRNLGIFNPKKNIKSKFE